MRIKTLLLGSAAAFAFAGGAAQAADLSVAEPVDYVRVCDAFGAGYWYIPGTDTCIAIGGEVEFRLFFDEDDRYAHSSNWRMRTQFDLNVTAKSMTDWGPLTSFVNLTGNTADNFDSSDSFVYADEYYLSLGPVLLGHTQSAFDIVGGGLTKNYGGGDHVTDLSDHKVTQAQLSWAISGFGLVLALEQPEHRWGSSATNDFPDLVAALSASGTGWDAAVSFLYSDQFVDTLWAVQGNLEIDVWGDTLQIGALWADDGSSANSFSDLFVEDGWAVLVSYRHDWSSNLYSAATVAFFDDDNANSRGDGWGAQFTTAFSPATGLWVGADGGFYDDANGDHWVFTLFAERKFGG